jgi:alpha-glucosidase
MTNLKEIVMFQEGLVEKRSLSNVRILYRYARRMVLPLLAVSTCWSAQPWTVSSPNEALVIEAKQDIIAAISSSKNCYFRVLLGGNAVIDWSPLGVTTSDQNFVTNLTFVKDSQATIDETYSLPSGKRLSYRNNCKELILLFSNANSRQVAFYLRAYNEAAALRSELRGTGSAQVTGEVTGFTIASGTGWGHSPGGNEKGYSQFSAGSSAGSYADPVLFKTANGWALLADVAVYGDYTGCNFSSKSASKNVYQITFTGGQGPISGTLPWKLPWRVAIVGSTLGPIVESSVVENLNPPCEVTDVSWIKPGRCAWSYPTQDNDHSVTLQKHYVDFASQMGWEYNTTDWNFDKSQMAGLCQYATQNKVDEELWYNYSEVRTQAQQDNIFSQCRTWGVKSLKIDFIFDNGDENTSCNQNVMKWYDMTAKNLAANKLMATMHGNTVPRGQRRRWPNVMTWEGVQGYEYVGRGYAGPKHNCSVPFIRQIIGPMDLTPVLFDLEQLSNGPGSQRTSTDAHELALSVIMESGLQHFADRPEYYNACVGKPFLQVVPAAWDDIHFIDGNLGETVILARRKGNDWYVAGISALSARTMSVPLSFLKAGSYTVDLYKDSTGGTKYTMAKQTVTINPPTPLSVWVNTNGGFCCRIPNSYDPNTGIAPQHSNAAKATRKQGGIDRLSLYHFVRDGAAGEHRLRGVGRVLDIRGKRITPQGNGRLPQGVFVPVMSE